VALQALIKENMTDEHFQQWLVVYVHKSLGHIEYKNIAIRNIHPFEYIKNINHGEVEQGLNYSLEYTLLNFFPMTKEQWNNWYGFKHNE